jgi:cytidyltransferase-like protein
MKIFRGFEDVKAIRNPVVITGSFDGVHIGHKTILNRLRMLAEKNNGESVLITFDPHPRKVLYPETFVGKDSTLLFHKKIHGSLSLSDPKTPARIDSAKEEIIDLIY